MRCSGGEKGEECVSTACWKKCQVVKVTHFAAMELPNAASARLALHHTVSQYTGIRRYRANFDNGVRKGRWCAAK